MSKKIDLPCPKCNKLHTLTEFLIWEEGGEKIHAPADVECSCGLISRGAVPIFKVTESGWILRPKKDDEPLRKA